MRSSLQVLKEPRFLNNLRNIALPIVAQNLIHFTVSAADTIMVGQLGEISLSAVSIANQLTFMYMVGAFGIAGGLGVLAAQHWGSGNIQKVREIIAFMLRLVLGLTIVFSALAFFLPEAVIGFIIRDEAVIAQGAVYLRLLSGGYLFFGFTTAIVGILRAAGIVKISVVTSIVALVVNISLNYILIFGHFGAPAMGVRGAAIASVCARALEFLVLCIYLLKIEKKLGFRLKHLLAKSQGIGRHFIRYSSPVLANEALWAAGNFMLGVILGRLGREVVAAFSISQVLAQFVGVFIFGVTAASATMIGNTIGAGNYAQAQRWAKALLLLSFLGGLFCALLVQILRLPLISLYDISPQAQIYARQMTQIISVHVILHAVALVGTLGVLRGGGDTKFAMCIDVLFIWLFALPLGAFAGLHFGLPIWLVFLFLRSEDLFKSALVAWRIGSGRWQKDITQDP